MMRKRMAALTVAVRAASAAALRRRSQHRRTDRVEKPPPPPTADEYPGMVATDVLSNFAGVDATNGAAAPGLRPLFAAALACTRRVVIATVSAACKRRDCAHASRRLRAHLILPDLADDRACDLARVDGLECIRDVLSPQTERVGHIHACNAASR